MIGQYPAICLIRDLCSFFSSSAPSSISISVVLSARIHAHFFLGLFPPCFPVTARCLYPLSAMGHERARESRPRISRVDPRVRAIKGKTTIVIRINQRGLGGATDPREESRANTSQSSSFRPISYVPVSACDFFPTRFPANLETTATLRRFKLQNTRSFLFSQAKKLSPVSSSRGV